jgi:hypothetical protein
MSFISAYIISSQMPQLNGGNRPLSTNFLANGQNFNITSQPACLPASLGAPHDMSPNTPTNSQPCPSRWKKRFVWAATDGFPGWNNTWHTTPFVGL